MIDRMLRRSGPGTCEICERKPATRKAKFTAQSLQSTSMPLFDEESLVSNEFEKRVCDDCLESLRNAKNVANLTFERL
jgi:hypothetical protein